VVEWWSGGGVEWWSGGVVEWWSGGVVGRGGEGARVACSWSGAKAMRETYTAIT